MIRINGLHKFFNKGRQNELHVINDVSLDLPEKGMVAIFGESGCGKTTLLNVIGGLDKYADGSVLIADKDIRQNTDVIRNQYIGYIFQNYNLHKSESCFDNVAAALRLCGMSDAEEIERRVTAALANVGMDKYSKRTPDTLSGGQQQRIAIARAIVKNPRIILADEPTGNLDDANTVMIMDLLKEISKDHLVLLVTHEAELVDYYCDMVINISDGKIVNTKVNTAANGFAARNKNDIYLGELAKSELSDENAIIEYYGEKPQSPIKLKIVNNGGKLYVQLGTEKVQIIDELSEIKFREGVYEEKSGKNAVSEGIDMSSLPPVKGTRFGRLFSFGSSIKSGYTENFKNRKKGKVILRGCMCLFAAVIVFMSSVFGTAFRDILDARSAYNHNVFYLYTPNAQVSERLNAAVGSQETGIDYIRLSGGYPSGDSSAYFQTGSFETFEQSKFNTNAVYLDVSLAEELRLAEGKKEDLAVEEILITTKVADALLEKSTLGYITERKDLIGLLSNMFTIDGKSPRIVGIVESDESAIYLTELAMAKYVRQSTGVSLSLASLGSDYGIEVGEGETVLAVKNYREDVEYPKVGDVIKIQGRELKVIAVKEAHYDYASWLKANGIEKSDEAIYFSDRLRAEQPELTEETEEFYSALDALINEKYYEYYDYYYSHIDDFCRDYYFFDKNSLDLWLYLEKGIQTAKYAFLPEEYFKAVKYKELYGKYPSWIEVQNSYDSLPDIYVSLKEYYIAYENEFYSTDRYSGFSMNSYMVSEADYIAFSKQVGETHPSALQETFVYYGKSVADEEVADSSLKSLASYEVSVDYYTSMMYYTVIHSASPEKTQAWLSREFSDLSTPDRYWPVMLTPDNIFDSIIEVNMENIIVGIIAMAVILVLMSICMYFIMRSSLMNRIKEVGIYRAIGVSKKNLVFKFFIEALVLTTLTVFVGYIITSAFLALCLGISSLVSQIFYYPLWLAGAILVILYAMGMFFGTLPIISLLRKTPSEILAKYDI